MNVLGDMLHETRILSPVRRKLRRFGFPTEAHLVQLAIHRGCRHYLQPGPPIQDPGPALISNLEIAAALLSNEALYNPTFIRVAAQLIGGENNPESILRIADMERIQTPLRHIAQAGHRIEPDNPFWKTLLERLPKRNPPEGVLPHSDRFTTESTLHAGQLHRARPKRWLRPV